MSLARIVKLNESELATLSRLFDQTDVVRWLTDARGVELVAVTRGARGAELASATERWQHPGFPASSAVGDTVGDAVGAGDAFSAALSLELGRGAPPEAALSFANRYAAHVASRSGAMPAPPEWLASELETRSESV